MIKKKKLNRFYRKSLRFQVPAATLDYTTINLVAFTVLDTF